VIEPLVQLLRPDFTRLLLEGDIADLLATIYRLTNALTSAAGAKCAHPAHTYGRFLEQALSWSGWAGSPTAAPPPPDTLSHRVVPTVEPWDAPSEQFAAGFRGASQAAPLRGIAAPISPPGMEDAITPRALAPLEAGAPFWETMSLPGYAYPAPTRAFVDPRSDLSGSLQRRQRRCSLRHLPYPHLPRICPSPCNPDHHAHDPHALDELHVKYHHALTAQTCLPRFM
jgi:hypothetical protein